MTIRNHHCIAREVYSKSRHFLPVNPLSTTFNAKDCQTDQKINAKDLISQAHISNGGVSSISPTLTKNLNQAISTHLIMIHSNIKKLVISNRKIRCIAQKKKIVSFFHLNCKMMTNLESNRI